MEAFPLPSQAPNRKTQLATFAPNIVDGTVEAKREHPGSTAERPSQRRYKTIEPTSTNKDVRLTQATFTPATFSHRPFAEKILQAWDGTVTSFGGDTFTAVLTDRTNPDNPEEEVTVNLKSPHLEVDTSLIKPGAVFSWYMGRVQGQHVPTKKFSRILFRMFPKWTQSEIDTAKAEAARFIAKLDANNK